jgi:hypothetical protein
MHAAIQIQRARIPSPSLVCVPCRRSSLLAVSEGSQLGHFENDYQLIFCHQLGVEDGEEINAFLEQARMLVISREFPRINIIV